jgi:hypothetical protein
MAEDLELVRDGKVVGLRMYWDRGDGLAAAGLAA